MESIQKGLVEALRIAVLAAIPVVISGLESQSIDWRVVGIVAGIAILRFVDKTLHEYGKTIESQTIMKGLTRF